MELVKIIGIAFITAIAVLLIKPSKPEISLILTIVGCILIAFISFNGLQNTIASLQSLVQASGINNGLVKIFLKIIGVGYIVEFSAGILKDFGSQSLADKIILAGKIVIVILALPIFQSLLSLVNDFLQFV